MVNVSLGVSEYKNAAPTSDPNTLNHGMIRGTSGQYLNQQHTWEDSITRYQKGTIALAFVNKPEEHEGHRKGKKPRTDGGKRVFYNFII